MYSLLIKNATVIDGSGNPGRIADVAVQGDGIVNIAEKIDSQAQSVIDAGGKILSPGFVDLQNHSDSYWQPLKGLLIPEAQIYAGVASVIAMAVLYILLNRTRLGQALRATADDSDAASWVGINTRRMRGFGFGLGVAIAAAAGCALVTFNTATPTVGLNYLFIMFVSVAA